MNKGINVLSLFDGLSGAQVALNRSEIRVNNYFSSEIDKYSSTIMRKNFPNTIELGDITKINGKDLPQIDLLVGGSPCQGFSFAGRGLNFDDPRSKLFFEYVRLLKEIKPKYFLLENVRMKQEHRDIISKYLGVDYVEIDSALVSGQSRKRLYWGNFEIKQPEDRGILLKDILEDDNVIQEYKTYVKNKSNTNRVGGRNSPLNSKHQWDSPFLKQCIEIGKDESIKGFDILKRIYSREGKSPTITTMQGGHRQPKVSIDDLHYRRLTPLECERLQTFDDNFTKEGINEKGNIIQISNSQRYKALGNAFNVETIAYILKEIRF